MPVSVIFLGAAGLVGLIALLGFFALLRKRGFDKDAILDASQDPGDLGTGD